MAPSSGPPIGDEARRNDDRAAEQTSGDSQASTRKSKDHMLIVGGSEPRR